MLVFLLFLFVQQNQTFLPNNRFIKHIIAYKLSFSEKSVSGVRGLQLAGYAFHGFFAADFAVVAVCHKLNVTIFEFVELQNYKCNSIAD